MTEPGLSADFISIYGAKLQHHRNYSAMNKNLPPLCPLFDTLEHLQNTPKCVQPYLENMPFSSCQTEFELTKQFLQSYAGSQDTFNAYRREVERVLQYCWLVRKISLSTFTRNELRDYLNFCQNPPAEWLSTKHVARFIVKAGERQVNPEWRPFVLRPTKTQIRHGIHLENSDYRLSPKSQQALLATLSTFFNFLQQEDYLTANPVQLLRQKNRIIQREQSKRVTRKLSRLQWQYVIDSQRECSTDDLMSMRVLFILSAFYLLGLRISELAHTSARTPLMSDFAPDKEGRWWFTTVGKGNKLRDVAVPDELLDILKRYRQILSLPPLPYRGEITPLIPKARGRGGLGIRHLRALIQQAFNAAVYQLAQNGLHDEAEDLASATVHWLRHTAISHDVEFRPREHVRDDAGHGSATTTDQYIDIDRHERHESARKKKLLEEH